MNRQTYQSRRSPLPDDILQAMRGLVQGELELPLFPDTAARVMAACKDESADMKDVSDLITHDQALAVHVLRISNSAAYAPREPIITLQQAITRLGLATICDIAVAISLKGRVFAVPGYQTRLRELWMHSAATAAFAKETASFRGARTESVFLSGLLHDIGMPLVMQVFHDFMKKRGDGAVMRQLMDAAMEGFHVEVGAMAAQKWGLSPQVVAVVRHHHDAAKATSHREEVLISGLADELAYWALDDSKGKEDFRTELQGPLRLSEDDISCLLARRGRVIAVSEAFL